jgi:cbb3-type cytochrome oxidase subunit 3
MSRTLTVVQRGAEAVLTALLMIVSLAVFWPVAYAHRKYLLR